ncbi:helix-turn-helix domain-containing protein [Mycobacteroides abscessus]
MADSRSEGYLTPAEAARHLHVSLRTIQRYIATGKLPALKTPGGHYRIKESDVAAALA